MMKAALSASFVLVLAGVASAVVTDVNSVQIRERVFNDYPDSTLVTTNNYPSVVRFAESPFGEGGFANRHLALFSENGGASARGFSYGEAWDLSFQATISAPAGFPRQEAGFYIDTLIAGDGTFQITSDGEVAAFGGGMPFHTFGIAYTAGTTATMGMKYRPGPGLGLAGATMEYIFNGMSSGPKLFDNTEFGLIPGSLLGFKAQHVPASASASVTSTFGAISLVPAPGAVAAFAAVGLAGLRRRR